MNVRYEILVLTLQFFHRYLLKFGQVTHYLGYNAMQDFFPTMSVKPNETCDDYFCRQRQKEIKQFKLLNPVKEEEIKEETVIHETNDWGNLN